MKVAILFRNLRGSDVPCAVFEGNEDTIAIAMQKWQREFMKEFVEFISATWSAKEVQKITTM